MNMTARDRSVSALPLSLAPRGLSRLQSAEYVGISPTKFDELVADGRMPKPKKIDSRRLWDRLELDLAFAALETEDESPTKHPWD
jgi:predicted DNA-binding transcriptional regulator AlpA